jgi:hypothetical protein
MKSTKSASDELSVQLLANDRNSLATQKVDMMITD